MEYCINRQYYQEPPMHSQYRQNYVPGRPLPHWLQRLLSWL